VIQGLNAQVVKGLAFGPFMYNQGLEQVGRPQPLATTALLSFHDAAELFLVWVPKTYATRRYS